MLQNVPDRDRSLTALGELRPVGGNRVVEAQLTTLGEEMDKEGDEGFAGRVDVEQRVARTAQHAVQHHLVVVNHVYLGGRTLAAVLLFEQVHHAVNGRHLGTVPRGERILLSVSRERVGDLDHTMSFSVALCNVPCALARCWPLKTHVGALSAAILRPTINQCNPPHE
jgi:hypothetical protein